MYLAKEKGYEVYAALSWDIIEGLTLRAEVGAGRNWGETKYYENSLLNSAYSSAFRGITSIFRLLK